MFDVDSGSLVASFSPSDFGPYTTFSGWDVHGDTVLAAVKNFDDTEYPVLVLDIPSQLHVATIERSRWSRYRSDDGVAIEIDGGTAVIAEALVSGHVGNVFIYDISNRSTPQLNAQLRPSSSATREPNDFGNWVAIGDGVVLVRGEDRLPTGAENSIYVFDAGLAFCPGDMDGAGVGVSDLLSVIASLGEPVLDGYVAGDFDNSGDISVNDLLVVIDNLGQQCP